MKNQVSNKTLAQMLLKELDALLLVWFAYFKQEGKSSLESFDGFSSFSYVHINILQDALSIFHLCFEQGKTAELSEKIKVAKQEFDTLFDPFGEYFDWNPAEINDIAYLTHACFEHCDTLFIDFDKEKLSFYLDFAHRVMKNHLESNEKNKP